MVLLVIADVVNGKQLECLAGKHEWYGPGSMIIITSRDEHLLRTHGVDEVYKPNGLNYDEALQLFRMNAFKAHQPLDECVWLSKHFVNYADGLPLAIKVMGSFLNGRSLDEWRSTLERLQICPPDEILDLLRISFDGLRELEKKIFLDVACFFKGKDKDYVTKILEGCGFFPVIGIEVLIEKSLLIVDNSNGLQMHDLLQELGHQIVHRQAPEEPGKRSRLRGKEEVEQVLTESTGSEAVEGIMIDHMVYITASAKAFSLMTNLRLLKINNVQLSEGLEYLSNKLRLLDWHQYPLKSLPSNLQLDKTVEFKMCFSDVEELWKGIKPLNMLKVMKLRHSENLIKTPDFTEAPNLVELDLERCTRLREIHPSLLHHNKLNVLNLKGCKSLTTLPGKIFMESLGMLVFSGCSKLKKFPDIEGRMECLSKLLLDRTAIQEPPLSIGLLYKLILLDLNNCKNLKSLPGTISGLKSLSNLDLSGDLKIPEFPEIIGHMEHLLKLHLGGTAIRELPVSTELMSGLVLLNLKDCRNLWSLPITISSLKCLKTLVISGCSKLVKFPESVISMEDLLELFLDGTSITEVPSSIELLTKLQLLNLNDCKTFVRLPSSINGLKSLKTLSLSGCFKLENVPESVGQLESLEELDISGTTIRQPPSSIFLMKNLKELCCHGCKGSPSSTSWFLRFPINLMRRSSDPVALSLASSSGLCSLTKLDISDCNLGEEAIPSGIGNLCSLEKVIFEWKQFVSLPASIYRLSNLWKIELEDCKMLQSLPRLPATISYISLDGCVSLETLSDVLKLNKYRLRCIEIKCMDCLKLPGNNDLALSLLKEYIEHCENVSLSKKFLGNSVKLPGYCSIVVPGSEIPEWFEYQNNEGSSIRISTPPKTYKSSKLVGYAMCCVFHVHKYSLPYYTQSFPYPVHKLNIGKRYHGTGLVASRIPIYFRKQFGQAVSDHLLLHYEASERISEVSFSSPSGLELKRCGVHPIYVHQVDKFN